MSRFIVVITGLASMALAYSATDLIFWLVLFAWGGLGAAFGAALIFSLYWKKTTKYGVTAGMVTGAWSGDFAGPGGVFRPDERIQLAGGCRRDSLGHTGA